MRFSPLGGSRVVAVLAALLCSVPSFAAHVRHYYVAAEDTDWDYAPNRRDLITARELPRDMRHSGTQFRKTRYVEYTDATFAKKKPQPAWLGILGPVIRAEVGDTIIVDFLNRSSIPHNMHPHGLRYDKASEGALYVPYGAGARVEPGARFRYKWFADKTSGPAPGSTTSSVVWMYHAHDDEPMETGAGLMGPIIVTAAGKAKPDGSPVDVEREFVALFMIFMEQVGQQTQMFYAINGYVFGNLPGLIMTKGDRVRWHLIGMGDEDDIHTPHWHSTTVRDGARYTDVVELLPASMKTVDMVAETAGTWLFHCQVAEHMENGMMATFTVHERGRRCPVALEPDFWNWKERYRVTVTNKTPKKILAVHLRAEYMPLNTSAAYGFADEWQWNEPIKPGDEDTFELQDSLKKRGLTGYFSDKSIVGWAVYPTRIDYSDGTKWTPNDRGECFEVSWRDESHPQLEVLPALQPDAELPEDFPPQPRVVPRTRMMPMPESRPAQPAPSTPPPK